MTAAFHFDQTLRRLIAERLDRFDARRGADPGELKRAAVAIVVAEADTPRDAAFLLTRRVPRLRAHGGQWALPGGRLDDYPTRSGYLISPVVVWAPGATLVPNPEEVGAVHRIGCAELFRDGSPEIVAIEESDRPIIRLPLPVGTINAPTAAMLYQFREVALAGRATRVDHFEQPVFAWR